jgi:TPP-dependent pyruvate/acetoin dehydrogenase alpha subunit
MPKKKGTIALPLDKEEIIKDYRLAYQSRQVSLIGRREVLRGKAKFGIFGDGKEIAQLAIARAFRKGDWRSGYYRDQTWMFMLGLMSIQEFFAQLYSHADVNYDPASAGRQMNAHFASRNLYPNGTWRPQTQMYNTASDVSPTAAQMPRAVGLAYASVAYRNLKELHDQKDFSNNGNEITFATIGNASTAEGLFWESVNAIGVLKAPAIITIYDDGYGISVPNQFQMVKENIGHCSRASNVTQSPLEKSKRLRSLHCPRMDYPPFLKPINAAGSHANITSPPSCIIDVTQPQGHSNEVTERYKTPERSNSKKS